MMIGIKKACDVEEGDVLILGYYEARVEEVRKYFPLVEIEFGSDVKGDRDAFDLYHQYLVLYWEMRVEVKV